MKTRPVKVVKIIIGVLLMFFGIGSFLGNIMIKRQEGLPIIQNSIDLTIIIVDVLIVAFGYWLMTHEKSDKDLSMTAKVIQGIPAIDGSLCILRASGDIIDIESSGKKVLSLNLPDVAGIEAEGNRMQMHTSSGDYLFDAVKQKELSFFVKQMTEKIGMSNNRASGSPPKETAKQPEETIMEETSPEELDSKETTVPFLENGSFCRNCGAKLRQNAKYCEFCGKSVQ